MAFYGPDLIAHFLAGNVPAPSINSICFGLLLKSANLVKVSSRDPVFRRSLSNLCEKSMPNLPIASPCWIGGARRFR